MPWKQLILTTERASVQEISTLMETAGALSVTCSDAADQPLLEPLPGETPLWAATQLTALFDVDADLSGLQSQLAAHTAVLAGSLHTGQLEDRDWSNTWREDFSAMRFGKKLWVCPDGEQVDEPRAVILRLDPGLAFGTGTHATTALCLEWLDAYPPVGRDVIDYGCGSGILALAACLLGARNVHAVDIDPQALTATRENARRNGIGSGLQVSQPGALQEQQADVLLANILAGPLIELADELTARLRSGGDLVMTGILATQADQVTAAYRDLVEFTEPVLQEGWVLLRGCKR